MSDTSAAPLPVHSQDEWQHILDEAFPRGAIMGWDDENRRGITYQVAWIWVRGMNGDHPLLSWTVSSSSGKGFDLEMSGFERVQQNPLVALVTFADEATPMLWSAGLSDQLAHGLEPDRAEAQREAADHPGA